MIFTFYSYKGGVGRSMTMANVAHLLCKKGRKVLMVDWDLEAPGLERYFKTDSREIENVLNRPGIIDLLQQYKRWMANMPLAVAQEAEEEETISNDPLAPLERVYRSALEVLETDPKTGGMVQLLSAGRRSADSFKEYAKAVRGFDWMDFIDRWEGELYFEWLREQFSKPYPHITLIDSRTGVTEMGGVCTYHLADVIVMLCAANQQNLEGTDKMAEDFRSNRTVKLIIVPARIDKSEGDQLNTFKRNFLDKLDRLGDTNAFWDLRIPYVPYYAYQEKLAAKESNLAIAEDMVSAFNLLVEAIEHLDRPEPASVPPRNILIYLICSERDQKDTIPIREYLEAQGFEIHLPVFRGKPALVAQMNEAILKTCDAVLLYYGHGGQAWKNSQDDELKKINFYRDGKPLLANYTYLAPPITGNDKELIATNASNLINGLDGFSETAMEMFVQVFDDHNNH